MEEILTPMEAQNLAEEFKEQSLRATSKLNTNIYYNIRENISQKGVISLTYIGNEPKKFRNKITDFDLKLILAIYQPFSKHIHHIDFSFNLISEDSFEVLHDFLCSCEELVSLNLQYNIIGTKGGINILSALYSLKERGLLKLQYLNLEGCRIHTDGLLQIHFERKLYDQEKTLVQKFLENNQTLKELNLGENDIDETGLIETFSLLSDTNNICHLQNLCLDSPYKLLFTEETAYQLSKVLKNNKHIEKLSLRKSGLTDECLIILVKEIMENDNFRVWDLGSNHISYKGCEYLSGYLKSPFCNLQSLILNNNQIRDNGVEFLVKGLENNSNLVHLNLNYNGLKDEGLLLLA